MSCDGEILDNIVKHEHPELHHIHCSVCGNTGGSFTKVGSGPDATYRHTDGCITRRPPYNRADRRRLGLA